MKDHPGKLYGIVGVSLFVCLVALILFFAVFLVFPAIGYNAIQTKDEAVAAAWGDVEAAFQRRADLIPSLVAVVKGVAAHEKEIVTAVTEARAGIHTLKTDRDALIKNPEDFEKFLQSQAVLNAALSRLFRAAQKYPELKATQAFRDLSYQLEGSENRIHVARTRYNDAVMAFNQHIRRFPNNLINRYSLNLPRHRPFRSEEGAGNPPPIDFTSQ